MCNKCSQDVAGLTGCQIWNQHHLHWRALMFRADIAAVESSTAKSLGMLLLVDVVRNSIIIWLLCFNIHSVSFLVGYRSRSTTVYLCYAQLHELKSNLIWYWKDTVHELLSIPTLAIILAARSCTYLSVNASREPAYATYLSQVLTRRCS